LIYEMLKSFNRSVSHLFLEITRFSFAFYLFIFIFDTRHAIL